MDGENMKNRFEFDLDDPMQARVFLYTLKLCGHQFCYTGQFEDENDKQVCWAAKQMYDLHFKKGAEVSQA